MKKTFLSMLMIASCFSVANAQFVMDENGNISIGISEENTLKSQFTINDVGSDNTEAYIKSTRSTGLTVSRREQNVDIPSMNCAIVAFNTGESNIPSIGVYSGVHNAGSLGKGIGVLGYSGYTNSNYNFGVIGKLYRTVNGAAIYGTSVHNDLTGIDTEGRYAGFFNGDTRVVGTLTASSVVTSSDYRLKRNIRSLSQSDGCLDKLMDMNVVEYNNIQREFKTGETAESIKALNDMNVDLCGNDSLNLTMGRNSFDNIATVNWYKEESPIIKNKHYGLIAQELKEIYPDLVVESQDGFLAINYLEIIPLLIRSVQELKCELDASKNSNAPVQREITRTADAEATTIDAIVTTLYQNTPNPFTESTLVQCDIAEGVVQADIYIYDMNGKQITTYPIAERGATSITIEGRSLEAGMYLYALIADGQVIDTKRMILTK